MKITNEIREKTIELYQAGIGSPTISKTLGIGCTTVRHILTEAGIMRLHQRITYQCIECKKDTFNPKFCCRSCSATYYNKFRKLNGEIVPVRQCLVCQKSLKRNHKNFCSHKCHKLHTWQIIKNKIIETGYIYPSTMGYTSAPLARRFLTEEHGYKCSICGISEWQNKPLVMILDHIDGNGYNWHITNIRFVCSNCDSQLPTYKAKNKTGRKHRQKSR